MWQHIGARRWIWNYFLNLQQERYISGEKHLSAFDMIKLVTSLKQEDDHLWLNMVSITGLHRTCQDLGKAYDSFFAKRSGHPKFKSKKHSKPSFPVRESIFFEDGFVYVEKLGKLIHKTNYELPQGRGHKFSSPRVSYVGDKWLLTFGMECENQTPVLTDKAMGIDLGLKDLAIVSFGQEQIVFHNINKSRKMRQLERKRRHMQRVAARRKKGSQRRAKADDQIARIFRHQANIRQNYRHQTTRALVNRLPCRVVMEELNVSGMMKNRYLARAIVEQGFNEFIQQMRYKCEWYCIEFFQVPRFYPSSKTCSNCGEIIRSLKLSERTFNCPSCGISIDRDLNAALNLEAYKPPTGLVA